MTRFPDHVVVVTGGAGAIGAAAARRFAEEGATVVVVDRDADGADAIVRELARTTQSPFAMGADVGDPADSHRVVRTVVDRFGRLDVLFNNAGIAGAKASIPNLAVTEFDEVVRTNLRGTFLMLSEAARAMIEGEGGGAIVNMSSSMAGWDVLAGGAAYAATKHGVIGLTRTAALELAPYGIRVNAICPGVIETTLGIPDLLDGDAGRSRFESRIPRRRVGQPDEVAAAVAFLASADAGHITGASLLIDGGQTLQSWANSPDSDAYPLRSDFQTATTEGGSDG